MELDPNLDVFFGRSSDASTWVYARVRHPAGSRARLSGSIRGPLCQGARTLPLSSAFAEVPGGDTLLACAVVPDLATWSPFHPNRYHVHIEVRFEGAPPASADREWGVRRFGRSGASLRWDAKRWVLRGVRPAEAPAALAYWREASTTLVVTDPDDDLCRRASREGACVMACLSGAAPDLERRIHRLARWPAVLLTAITGELPEELNLAHLAPNMVFAAWEPHPAAIPDWAEVVCCPADDGDGLRALHQRADRPIIAIGAEQRFDSFRAARESCDRLQAQLATIGQFAGYVSW